jgi:hypothetical protein
MMNKLDLARHLARRSHRSRAQAADDVDSLVHRMLKDLKQAQRRPAVTRKEPLSAVPLTAPKENNEPRTRSGAGPLD